MSRESVIASMARVALEEAKQHGGGPPKLMAVLESAATPPKEKTLKHGDHDQSTHGNWASGGGEESEDSTRPSAEDLTPDRTTPAWDGVTQAIAWQGVGNCYQASLTLMLDADRLGLQNPVVVQATVMGQGALEGVRYGHSWLEADGSHISFPAQGLEMTTRVAIDYSSGNRVVMDADVYRHLGQAQDVHEYDQIGATAEAIRTETYGPWPQELLDRMEGEMEAEMDQ